MPINADRRYVPRRQPARASQAPAGAAATEFARHMLLLLAIVILGSLAGLILSAALWP